MSLECFRGADFSQVAYRARHALGDDAMILHTRTLRDDGVAVVEVLAAPAATLATELWSAKAMAVSPAAPAMRKISCGVC